MQDAARQTMWAIGLFEGEGCITIRSPKDKRFPTVELALGMTDRDVVERFAAIVGCGNVHTRKRRAGWKTMHDWSVGGKKAEDLIMAWLPHLGERRASRGREVLAQLTDARSERQHAHRACAECGGDFIPAKYNHQQYCTPQCRDRNKMRRLRQKWKDEGKKRVKTGYAMPGTERDVPR